jgi:hypothetical protein
LYGLAATYGSGFGVFAAVFLSQSQSRKRPSVKRFTLTNEIFHDITIFSQRFDVGWGLRAAVDNLVDDPAIIQCTNFIKLVLDRR